MKCRFFQRIFLAIFSTDLLVVFTAFFGDFFVKKKLVHFFIFFKMFVKTEHLIVYKIDLNYWEVFSAIKPATMPVTNDTHETSAKFIEMWDKMYSVYTQHASAEEVTEMRNYMMEDEYLEEADKYVKPIYRFHQDRSNMPVMEGQNSYKCVRCPKCDKQIQKRGLKDHQATQLCYEIHQTRIMTHAQSVVFTKIEDKRDDYSVKHSEITCAELSTANYRRAINLFNEFKYQVKKIDGKWKFVATKRYIQKLEQRNWDALMKKVTSLAKKARRVKAEKEARKMRKEATILKKAQEIEAKKIVTEIVEEIVTASMEPKPVRTTIKRKKANLKPKKP